MLAVQTRLNVLTLKIITGALTQVQLGLASFVHSQPRYTFTSWSLICYLSFGHLGIKAFADFLPRAQVSTLLALPNPWVAVYTGSLGKEVMQP